MSTQSGAPSLKKMAIDKLIRRTDGYKVKLSDIHEEPGFNYRIENDDLHASIDSLTNHILMGGQVPALEVRPRSEGGVYVVDGHRRRRAFLRAVERGAPIEYVSVVPFVGNDLERVARVITSAEGRPLKPYEMAIGVKRLSAFNLSPQEIAEKIQRSTTNVEQLLLLANSNHDVHELVKNDLVSAYEAIKAIREHGDKAGEYLQSLISKARNMGKKRVTASVTSKPLPKRLAVSLLDRATELRNTLLSTQDESVKKILSGEQAEGQVTVDASTIASLLACIQEIETHQAKKAEKAALQGSSPSTQDEDSSQEEITA